MGHRHVVGSVVGDTLDIRHASLLTIVECDGYTVADVKSPWNGLLLQRYILVDKDSLLPAELPKGTLLRTPLNNILIFATVHAQLICDLGCDSVIRGVCESRYMTQPQMRRGLQQGIIVDCGSSLNIDLEQVVQLAPEAIWVLPYENGGYGKLDKLDFPLIECVEYMETSPLGGAEWLRFYGRLLGCALRADSLFKCVEKEYMALCSLAASAESRPKLLCELKSSSAWYMPAGGSTMGVLYKDAGADYLFGDNISSGSLPLSFETVLDRASDADIWLIKYAADVDKKYGTLLAEFAGYEYFKPFKERKIYACNLSRKRFYEETPFRPDILLRELIALFQPHLIENPQLRYYEKMEE